MKSIRLKETAGFLALALWGASLGIGHAQVIVSPPNYTVTTPGNEFEFAVNGATSGQTAQDANVDDSLNFTLSAGATYIFSMNTASFHPVDICTNANTTSFYTGASRQTVSSGTVMLTIPATNYPDKLYYICNIHTFYGIITVAPPQPPPTAKILNDRGDDQHCAHLFGRDQHHPTGAPIQFQFGFRRLVSGSKLYQQLLGERNQHHLVQPVGCGLRAGCFPSDFAGSQLRNPPCRRFEFNSFKPCF